MSGCGCDSREPGAGCFTALALTSAEIFSTLACGSGFCPTTAAGAVSQRPMQGACSTRTSFPRMPGSFASSSLAPAISQAIESHTRTVIAGGGTSPSLITFLDAVQMLDQQIATERRVFQEGAYFLAGFGIDAAPFGRAAHARAFRGLPFFLGPRSNSVVHEPILPPG